MSSVLHFMASIECILSVMQVTAFYLAKTSKHGEEDGGPRQVLPLLPIDEHQQGIMDQNTRNWQCPPEEGTWVCFANTAKVTCDVVLHSFDAAACCMLLSAAAWQDMAAN